MPNDPDLTIVEVEPDEVGWFPHIFDSGVPGFRSYCVLCGFPQWRRRFGEVVLCECGHRVRVDAMKRDGGL